LGKTTLVLQATAQANSASVEIYVPTHQLGEELAQKLRAEKPGLTVNVIAGRSQIGADGKPLCKKHELAE
jgi:hypothetical protein